MTHADLGVHGGCSPDSELVENVHNPPNSHPVPIVALSPRPHSGGLPFRLERMTREAMRQGKELDVRDDPDSEVCSIWPRNPRALSNRDIRKGSVVTRLH